MDEKDLPSFLDNVMVSSGSGWEAIKAFLDEPEIDVELLRKFKRQEREREELDMLKRVRKIIESK